MIALKVYGIKSCDSCKEAIRFLQAKDIDYHFHDVRDDGLDIQMLERWAGRVSWEKLLNKNSLTWRRVPETDRRDINREKALALMLEQPTLVKRPVFEANAYIAVGFSEKRFSEFLSELA